MRLNEVFLTEANAVNDREYRNTAKKVYQDILRSLERIDSRQFMRLCHETRDFSDLTDPIVFGVSHLTGERDDNNYQFQLVIMPFEEGGSFTPTPAPEIMIGIDRELLREIAEYLGSEIYLEDYSIDMTLNIDQIRMNSETLDYRKIVQTALTTRYARKLFVHEHIHFQDNRRENEQGEFSRHLNKQRNHKSQEDYFNSSEEFNSYYQEAISELDEEWEKMPDSSKEYIMGDFETFKQFVIKRYVDSEFYESLTTENQRRFIKRLYQAYEDFLDQM